MTRCCNNSWSELKLCVLYLPFTQYGSWPPPRGHGAALCHVPPDPVQPVWPSAGQEVVTSGRVPPGRGHICPNRNGSRLVLDLALNLALNLFTCSFDVEVPQTQLPSCGFIKQCFSKRPLATGPGDGWVFGAVPVISCTCLTDPNHVENSKAAACVSIKSPSCVKFCSNKMWFTVASWVHVL